VPPILSHLIGVRFVLRTRPPSDPLRLIVENDYESRPRSAPTPIARQPMIRGGWSWVNHQGRSVCGRNDLLLGSDLFYNPSRPIRGKCSCLPSREQSAFKTIRQAFVAEGPRRRSGPARPPSCRNRRPQPEKPGPGCKQNSDLPVSLPRPYMPSAPDSCLRAGVLDVHRTPGTAASLGVAVVQRAAK